MPIDYSQYHPKWFLISRLTRFKRAKNKCEWCGVPNYELIYRDENGWHKAPEGHYADAMALDGTKFTKTVLTVAHIDHNKKNNRFDNLVALCQKCHLGHDIGQHVANRKYGRNWKDNQLSLL